MKTWSGFVVRTPVLPLRFTSLPLPPLLRRSGPRRSRTSTCLPTAVRKLQPYDDTRSPSPEGLLLLGGQSRRGRDPCATIVAFLTIAPATFFCRLSSRDTGPLALTP